MKYLILCVLILLPSVLAGYISITTYTDVGIITENNTNMSIKIRNSGTDEARNVKVSLISDQFRMKSENLGTIYPDSEKSANFVLFSENLKKGTYVSAIIVEYNDQAGKSFSAITPVNIVYKEPSSSRLAVELENIEINEQSTTSARVKIKNNDFYEKNASVKIYLPHEFSVYPLEAIEKIQPGREKTAKFLIRNAEGLNGSEYAIFASASYEDENYHYSEYKIGILKVVSKKALSLPILLAIALLLLTLTITYLQRKKKK